jgi:transcriptional regulator with XRE-family HTH domain
MIRYRHRTSEGGLGMSVGGALDDLDPALQVARAIMEARTAAGLSQAQLAKRMSTAPSFVAKLESGRTLPSTTNLVRVARATDTLLRLELVRRCGLMEPRAVFYSVGSGVAAEAEPALGILGRDGGERRAELDVERI